MSVCLLQKIAITLTTVRASIIHSIVHQMVQSRSCTTLLPNNLQEGSQSRVPECESFLDMHKAETHSLGTKTTDV